MRQFVAFPRNEIESQHTYTQTHAQDAEEVKEYLSLLYG